MTMTNLEALGAAVNYPVDEKKLTKILIDNGMNGSDTYQGMTRGFELSTAALYILLVSSANISEGGYQISMADKSNMMQLADGIYSKYGLNNPLKANKVRNRSNRW